MKIEMLTESLLQGDHFHCRPVKKGPIVEALIIPSEDDSTPTFRTAIICPYRRAKSYCGLRDRPGVPGPRRCLWYKGDSRGLYQIVGPGMDNKTEEGYK